MHPVSFPNLNLTFHINPVAIEIGSFQIYWYGLLIMIAILVGLFLCKRHNGTFQISYETVFNYLFYAILIGIVCARLYYVLFHLDYYLRKPLEIVMLHHRWLGNLWRNHRGDDNCNCFLQKKQGYFSGFNRLYYSIFGVRTGNWALGKFCESGSVWTCNRKLFQNENF